MDFIKGIFDNITIAIIIAVALFSILMDGYNLKHRNLTREHNMLKVISYFYIAVGVGTFVIFKII